MKELNKSYKINTQFTYVDNVFLFKYSKKTSRQTINDLYKLEGAPGTKADLIRVTSRDRR